MCFDYVYGLLASGDWLPDICILGMAAVLDEGLVPVLLGIRGDFVVLVVVVFRCIYPVSYRFTVIMVAPQALLLFLTTLRSVAGPHQ